MTAATNLLERMGKSMFGKDFLRRTASLADINPATISKWRSGKIRSFDLTHPVFRRLIWHMRQQSEKLAQLADEAETIIAARSMTNGKDPATESDRPLPRKIL
jgi:hypothetical protein